MKRIFLLMFLLLPMLTSTGLADARPASLQADSDPATAATEISVLESQGRFSRIYDQMHPDAQQLIPRSTVVGWYENEFGPLGPGQITVTDVQYVSWTWLITGTIYSKTAEVFFVQPFANGRLVSEVVRLVESNGAWKWFFVRSSEFVETQIAIFGGSAGVSVSGSGSCFGADVWWQTTMPNFGATEYLSFTLKNIVEGGPVDPALLVGYADSFETVRNSQIGLAPPTEAAALQTDLLDYLEISRRLTQNLIAAESGLDAQTLQDIEDAIAVGVDRSSAVCLR